MAVKIRLARRGRKNRPFYHIVIADVRSPRDGKFIEKIGTFDPMQTPGVVDFNSESALSWLSKGAQPTKTVAGILSSQGVLFKKHLAAGVRKGCITQAIADKRFAEWEKIAAKKKRNPYLQAGAEVPEAVRQQRTAAQKVAEEAAAGAQKASSEAESPAPEPAAAAEDAPQQEVKAAAPKENATQEAAPAKEAATPEQPEPKA